MVPLGAGQEQKSVDGIGIVVARKWSPRIIFRQFRSSRIGMLPLRLDSNKMLEVIQLHAPVTTSDDDETEEFCESMMS